MTVHARDGRTAPPLTHAGRKDLTRLLDAVLRIGTDLDLHALLRRIVEAAADLVDARYGALGVLDESGDSLAEFIAVGVDAETCAAIGAPPKGLIAEAPARQRVGEAVTTLDGTIAQTRRIVFATGVAPPDADRR
jgi:hypothetical protein